MRAGTLVVVSEDGTTPREDERPAVDRCLFELGWDVKGCAMREDEEEMERRMVNMLYKAKGW